MFHENIYGRCAKVLPNSSEDIEFDIGLFLQRILLFEHFTLDSIRLKEIPLLAEKIGIDGLILLLESEFLKIHCEALSIGQIGQTSALRSVQEKGVLPLFGYRFASVSIADYDHYVEGCLREIKKIPNLTERQRKKVKRLLRSKLVAFNTDTRGAIYSSFSKDLALKDLVFASLKQVIEIPDRLQFELYRVNEDDWKVETNLCSLLNIEESKGHKIVERALLNISGIARKIYEMRDFDSLTGFQADDDFQIFEERLRPLSKKLTDDSLSKNFMRLLEIQGLPDFHVMVESGNFQIKKLLQIRQTKECEEFRKWLWNSANFSEQEIKERIRSLRSLSGSFLDSGMGRAIRFGMNTIVGVINPGIGLGLGAVDSFLLDKLLKKDGVSAFVNSQYPKLCSTY